MSAFTLLIRLSNGQRLEVGIDDGGAGGAPADSTSITVSTVKDCIARKDATSPAHRQRLIYKGRILENDRTLSDYDVANGATLFMVKAAAAAPSTTASSVPRPAAAPMLGLQQQQQQGTPNPFGMPPNRNMNMVGQQQQQGAGMPDPEQMQAMMNSPHMQGLLDNPEMLGSILENSMQSPQMQQLMEQNPELRQLYSDPAMIQQAIQMMRNPQHMQQVMRQQDLAMSQLENMPGGFAALSSMYRNVQEPMMEAQQESRNPSDGANGRSSSGGGTDGATGAAMPNPWGSPTPPPPATHNSNINRSSSSNNSSQMSPFGGAMMGAGAAASPWAAPGGMPNPWGGAAAAGGGGMPNPWGGAAAAGGGMPVMPPVGGGQQQQPNMDQMMQMLDNPAMSQMMNDMVQNNPDMIRSMLEAQNPMMRQMFAGNPEMANNFIRNTFNPANMRNMVDMQRNMQNGGAAGGTAGGMPNFGAMGGMAGMPNFGAMGGMPPPPAAAAAAGMGGAPGAGGEMDFSTLLQQFQQTGFGAGAAPGFAGSAAPGFGSALPSAPPATPADRYRTQLQSLYGMGFDDERANLTALQANHGNLNRAVDQLLMAPPASSPAPAPAASASNVTESATDESTPKDSTEKKND